MSDEREDARRERDAVIQQNARLLREENERRHIRRQEELANERREADRVAREAAERAARERIAAREADDERRRG